MKTSQTSVPGSPPHDLAPLKWMNASDGAEIPYRRLGSGPPLVLLHGWSQSGVMFSNQLSALSDQFTVIIPDLRGHGTSPDPGHGGRIARLATDLLELIDQLHLRRSHLLGWSMGASVIWSFIDLYGTAEIDRLIFVDQPSMLLRLPDMSEAEAADAGALFDAQDLVEACRRLRSAEGEAFRSGFVRGMVTQTIPDELLAWILAENEQTDVSFAAELLLSHCTNDWRDVLPRIDRRSLVIAGAVSHVSTRSQRFISRTIPGATYHEFSAEEGGAHFPFLEAPESFNAVVRSFLTSA